MATTLNPSEISELIRERIEQFKLSAETRNEGTLTSVSDGIVRIHGLNDAMAGEMIELPGDTFLRQITPGATFSMTSVCFALIGPLPSIGCPSELTTRPINSGPTGTSRMRPVVLAVSPSDRCS